MRGDLDKVTGTAVIIDSSPLRVQLYRPLLAQRGIDVVAVSPSLGRAADLAEVSDCDLLVVDAGEQADSGSLYRLLRRAHRRCPNVASVVLIDEADRAAVEAAVAAGACATLDRSADMRRVTRLTADAFAAFRAETLRAGIGSAAQARLTRREIEILRLVAEGRSNRQVGQLLWVTDQTVKFHLANAYRKLGVRNRYEASRWAIGRGLVKEQSVPVGADQLQPAGSGA
jgi:DNA-binding NarL/FixJ family response regulator